MYYYKTLYFAYEGIHAQYLFVESVTQCPACC